ncbi:MAG: hypothetical protein MI861_05750, partial [Pirellulales bacterium]|nr:hypothetical protein [Pirellulales bacterium]
IDLWMSVRNSKQDPWQPAQNLGPTINSEANDQSPELSADGLSLYFASDRAGGDSDLWFSTRQSVDAQWSKPRQVPGVNSPGTDLEPALSADGLTLLFASARPPKNGSFDIWMCRRPTTSAAWSKPVHLDSALNSADWQGSPCFSADEIGSVLIFHSVAGLRISTRSSRDALFATAEPLQGGKPLQNAYAPFLSADGQTLYFRSQGQGSDSHDLWVSRRVKE